MKPEGVFNLVAPFVFGQLLLHQHIYVYMKNNIQKHTQWVNVGHQDQCIDLYFNWSTHIQHFTANDDDDDDEGVPT